MPITVAPPHRHQHHIHRQVRHALATPLSCWDTPLAPETPWGRRARCDAYDRAIGLCRNDVERSHLEERREQLT